MLPPVSDVGCHKQAMPVPSTTGPRTNGCESELGLGELIAAPYDECR